MYTVLATFSPASGWRVRHCGRTIVLDMRDRCATHRIVTRDDGTKMLAFMSAKPVRKGSFCDPAGLVLANLRGRRASERVWRQLLLRQA